MFLSMNWISDFVDLTGLDKLKLINQFSRLPGIGKKATYHPRMPPRHSNGAFCRAAPSIDRKPALIPLAAALRLPVE